MCGFIRYQVYKTSQNKLEQRFQVRSMKADFGPYVRSQKISGLEAESSAAEMTLGEQNYIDGFCKVGTALKSI